MADPLTKTAVLQERLLAVTMAQQPNLVQVEPTHRLAQPLQTALVALARAILALAELQVLISMRMAMQHLALGVQKPPLEAKQARGRAVEPMRVGVLLQAQILIKVPEVKEQGMTTALEPILVAIQDQLLAATPAAQMVIMVLAARIRL